MGRKQGKGHEGGTATSSSSSSSVTNNRAHSLSPAPSSSSVTSVTTPQQTDVKIGEMLKEVFGLVTEIQAEREKGDHCLQNISKAHERVKQEAKGLII